MKVVNLRKEKYTIYIGRPSPLGNPYIIGKDGNREEVIRKYERFVRNNPKLLEVIKSLPANAVLGCFCKPLPCHGDIIVKIWEEINNPSALTP